MINTTSQKDIPQDNYIQTSKKERRIPPVEFSRPIFPPLLNHMNSIPPVIYPPNQSSNEYIFHIFSNCSQQIITSLSSLGEI